MTDMNGSIFKKFILLMTVILSLFVSCKKEFKEREVIFLAELETPMGWNHLRIYKGNTFQFESRRLLKSTFYEGTVRMDGDTIYFSYTDSVPGFGDTAVIDGVFLTYTNGDYRELLEISLDRISR